MFNLRNAIHHLTWKYRGIYSDFMVIIFSFFFILFILVKSQALISNNNLLSFTFGIIIFVFIPGYYLVHIIKKRIQDIDVIGYSFIFGIAIQIINIAIYHILSIVVRIDFQSLLIGATITSIIVQKIILYKMKIPLDFKHRRIEFSKSIHNPLIYVFIFTLIFHLYYGSFNSTSLKPDATLYLDTARTLVAKGTFGSHVINDDQYALNPYLVTNGLLEHRFFPYALSIFFFISDISFKSGQLLLIFANSLLVYPIYNMTKKLFDDKAAITAAILIAVHPIFSYFSAIMYGPEVLGLLFVFTLVYILFEGVTKKSPLLIFFSGVLLGIANDIWWVYFYMTIPITMLLFIIFYSTPASILNKKTIIKHFKLFIYTNFILLYSFAQKVYALVFIWLSVVVIEMTAFAFAAKLKLKDQYNVLSLVAGIIFSSALPIIRNYLTPLREGPTMEHAINKGLAPSILNAYTLYFKDSPLDQLIINYYKYLLFHSTDILLILFIFSFFIFGKWREKLFIGGFFFIHLILVSKNLDSSYPEFLYSQGRHFILVTTIEIIGASYFLSSSIKINLDYFSSFSSRITKIDNRIKLQFVTLIVIACCVIPVTFFVPRYSDGIKDILADNPIHKYRWSSEMLDWVENHISDNDILLTSRARELAWFTDRNAVNIMHPSLERNQIGDKELDTLADQFNAKYVIVDQNLYDTLPKLNYLYEFASLPVGTIIVPNDSISHLLTNTSYRSHGYQLAFGIEGYNAKIYKFLEDVKTHFKPLYIDNNFGRNWTIGNGGTFSNENGITKLVIGEGKEYTYLHRKIPLNITLENNETAFFAWSLGEEANNTDIKQIAVQFVDKSGNSVASIYPPVSPEIWTKYINVKNISDINLIISGKPGSYLPIEWIQIGSFQPTN